MVKYYECHLKGLKLKLCQQTDSQIPDGDFQGHQHCPNSFWHYANTRTIHSQVTHKQIYRFANVLIHLGYVCRPWTDYTDQSELLRYSLLEDPPILPEIGLLLSTVSET